jgi:hypothetical protein
MLTDASKQVGISETSTTTKMSTTTSAAPAPTQTGLAANCNKIVIAQSGDFCYMFAQENSELKRFRPANLSKIKFLTV